MIDRKTIERIPPALSRPFSGVIKFLAPPAASGEDFTEERAMIVVRWIGTAMTALLVPLLQPGNYFVAYGTLIFAYVYNGMFAWYLVPRSSPLLRGGYLGFTLDVLAVSVFIYAGGG